tara:strand:+ start:85 stop:669 length:585 start_codon:yes stop_codon:yes gene_type:complete
MDLNDLIQVYDYTLPEDVCKNIIKLFQDQILEEWDENGKPKFRQFNITQYIDDHEHELDQHPQQDWGLIQNALIESATHYVQKYMDDTGVRPYFPKRSALEQFRVKKYEKGTDDRFDMHVDVGDHDSARRFLSVFWYLNDVDEGGETEFLDGAFTVKPKTGRMVIFPPLWMYPHCGKPTKSHDKYLLSTYTHYV